MGNMGMADSEYHEKMMRLGQQRDAVPARRPVDDALDRLQKYIKTNGLYFELNPEDALATVRQVLAAKDEELQGLRDSLVSRTTYLDAAERKLRDQEVQIQRLTKERDYLYEANWPWEWVIATREKERRQAAEAEAQRYREGLREATDWMHANGLAPSWVAKARALLAASPTDGGGA